MRILGVRIVHIMDQIARSVRIKQYVVNVLMDIY